MSPSSGQDEDPAEVLAPGTARRQALDEALAEIAAGREEPSYEWRTKFALMLGLERVLTGKPPVLESGTELRRHQVDALAGMLTALITANQRELEEANGFDEPLPEGDDENGDLDGHRRRTASSTTSTRRRSPSATIPAPSAATASAIPRPRGRRSPPPASWRQPARPACSSSRTAGCS